MARNRGTYRVVLIHEQTETVAFDQRGMDAAKVEAAMEFLNKHAPAITAVTGAVRAWEGVERMMEGITAMDEAPRTGKRRRR